MSRRVPAETLTTEVLILGAGVAGMTTALHLAPRDVLLVSACEPLEGSATAAALGGIAAAVGADDSPELHAADTVAVGGGLVDDDLARLLSRGAPEAIGWLERLGVQFDRLAGGGLHLGREAGHSRARIVHARGHATGAELVRVLQAEVVASPWIRCLYGFQAVEWLEARGGAVAGARLRGAGGRWLDIRARATVLATGGIGQLFRWTTNPRGNWGSGWYLAARAGAELADCEFVQFHPTALRAEGFDPVPLLTEALRGAGALLLDEHGERLVLAEDPRGELAPRDVLARAIWAVTSRGGRVLLDARQAVGESFPERFPAVWAACRAAGFDPRREPVPVVPAAHYAMGGVAVDACGRTAVEGLFACGEVAASGLHGANRLASNSLLEGLVFGRLLATSLREGLPRLRSPLAAKLRFDAGREPSEPERVAVVSWLRGRAWDVLGLVREERNLAGLLAELQDLWPRIRGSFELEARLFATWAVAVAAAERQESRGAHFRSDFPREAPGWRLRQRWSFPNLPRALEARCNRPARPTATGLSRAWS